MSQGQLYTGVNITQKQFYPLNFVSWIPCIRLVLESCFGDFQVIILIPFRQKINVGS